MAALDRPMSARNTVTADVFAGERKPLKATHATDPLIVAAHARTEQILVNTNAKGRSLAVVEKQIDMSHLREELCLRSPRTRNLEEVLQELHGRFSRTPEVLLGSVAGSLCECRPCLRLLASMKRVGHK